MVKYISYILILMTTISFSGCQSKNQFSDKDMGAYEKILKKYHNLDSYTATVDLTVTGNKTDNKYRFKQIFKEPGKYATQIIEPEELKGLTTLIKDQESKVFMENVEKTIAVPVSEDLDFTFVNNFFKMYYSSEETVILVSADENSNVTRLETELIGFGANRYKAAMVIDNKTLNPIRLTVYDMAGKANMVAEYSDFVYNEAINEEIFTLEG